jgi:hypothetical protein
MLVPVKARALELLERDARNANRVYAVSRLELAQRIYGVEVPTRSMLSSLGRALNEWKASQLSMQPFAPRKEK